MAKPARKKTASDKNFKWTNQDKMKIASYLNEHFNSFKNSGEKSGKKAQFLRQMKDMLGLTCNETQLRNGFNSLIRKYMDIRNKLNASGFGIDPEKDSTLDTGWILKQCPYYEMLDEVMGTRPNVTPPFASTSSSFGEVGLGLPATATEDVPINSPAPGTTELPEVEEESTFDHIDDLMNTNQNDESDKIEEVDMTKYIRTTFPELGAKRKAAQQPKNALSAFANIMAQKMEMTNEVETKKIKLEHDKFEYTKSMDDKYHELEMLKVQNEHELQLKALEDKDKDREFQLERLKLQIDLAKVQK